MKESDVERLAKLNPQAAKKLLPLVCGLSLDFGYDHKLKSEIHCDFLYDVLTHSVSKGFSWIDVCKALELAEELLQSLIGKTVPEATTIYQEKVVKCGMDYRSVAIFTDFFFSTYMTHFKLYQYVFSQPRDETRFSSHITVEPPIPPDNLSAGKLPNLHEYEKKLECIQANRKQVKEVPQYSDPGIKLDDISNLDQYEKIGKIIANVVREVGQSMVEEISQAISSTYDELILKVEETALPRPKQLGPPPRYQTKPVLQMPKVTQSLRAPGGSAKGDRKASPKVK